MRILAAGAECFNTRGYAHTTMTRIARKAGVSTGTVYAYFSDKDDVLRHIMRDHLENVMAPGESWAASIPPDAEFRAAMMSLLRGSHAQQEELAGLHRVFHERIEKDEAFSAIADEFRARALEVGRRIVERFGGPRARRDVTASARVIIAVLEFCSHVNVIHSNNVHFEDVARVAIDMIDAYFTSPVTRRDDTE